MTTNTLGNMIGIVDIAYSIQMPDGTKLQISNKFDFRQSTDIWIKQAVCNSAKILKRTILKGLSHEEVLATSGDVVVVANAGKAIVSRSKQIEVYQNTFMDSGVSESQALQLATALVDKPETLAVVEDNEE